MFCLIGVLFDWRFFKRKCRGIDLNGGNGLNQRGFRAKRPKMEINLSILITPNRIEGQPNDRSLRACTGFGVHGSHNLVYVKG